MKIILRLLLVVMAFVVVTKCHAQTPAAVNELIMYKGPATTTAQDTVALKATRAAYQTSYGSTGGLYFDKARNKWKIWSGAKGAPSQDSSWVDLPIFAGTGTVTSVSGTAPVAVATGTTTPVISMPAAAVAQAGYVNTASQTFGGVKTLGSPVFTGVPVAPTAAPGTNTTQLATTAFVTAAVPATVTASNGLTKITNDIQLGGTTSADIDVNTGVHTYNIGKGEGVNLTRSGGALWTTDGSDILLGALNSSGGGNETEISVSDNQISALGTTAGFKGIEYGADYSASYSVRSLVDKTYADTKLDGTMVSTRVPYGVDANSLKTDGTGTFAYTEGASGYITSNHIRIGVPPWYGSVTYGIVSDSPAFGVNISTADGTVGTPTPFQVTIYGGKAYTSGNNLGGDVTIGSGIGNGTARSGNIIIDLGSSRGSLFGYLKILNIPTSSAGLPSGAVYSNAGILTIVP
jgi:hypothetical protein